MIIKSKPAGCLVFTQLIPLNTLLNTIYQTDTLNCFPREFIVLRSHEAVAKHFLIFFSNDLVGAINSLNVLDKIPTNHL